MSEKKVSLGQAIDAIIEALEPLDNTSRQTAINAACSHLGLVDINRTAQTAVTPTGAAPATQTKQTDIRSFKDQKGPKSAIQMACVVAYYFAPPTERKKAITASDLTTYFKQANFRLPKVITQVLPDSRVAGYFESGPGKGEYTLNAVGYNLVAHNLPKIADK
jgi:hypothetical protein